MGKLKSSLFIFLFTYLAFLAYAQGNPDSLLFIQKFRVAKSCFEREAYDSAFNLYKAAYQFAENKNLLDYYSSTSCLLGMGNCLYNQAKYPQSHQYYYNALINSRKFAHQKPLRIQALRMLNSAHHRIQARNLTFPYPDRKTFTPQIVMFDVDSVLWQQGDSALVRVTAGKLDGVIPDKNKAAQVYSIKDIKTGQLGELMGVAELKTIGQNKCLALLNLYKGAKAEPGWLIYLLTNVPDELANSAINNFFCQNIKWKSNDDFLNIFNRRYCYYFYDSLYTRDLMEVFKEELADVVKRLGPDSAKQGSSLGKKMEEGIFKGKNIIQALNESNGTTINYYLRYMVDNPLDFSGLPMRFSEHYATWVLGKTPMEVDDIRSYILGNERVSNEIIERATRLSNQIEEKNLVDYWVDEGLAFIDKNYWKDLLSQARLLYHYSRASNRRDYRAWADFFDAIRFKEYGYFTKADSVLSSAERNFKEAGSNEGMQWIQSVRDAVLDSGGIQMTIQRTHNLQFDIVASPNERYFATAGIDHTIKIWDINLAKQIKSIDAHTAVISQMAYNNGGRYLASVSEDSTIKIWNTFTYGLMNTIKTDKPHHLIEFSHDGKNLVTAANDSALYFWEPFTGNLTKRIASPGGAIKRFIILPEQPNQMFVMCSDSALYRLEISSGTSKQILKSNQPLWWMKISKRGKYLCYYSGDSTLSIYNLSGGAFVTSDRFHVWTFANSTYYSPGDFSPDEKYFIFMRPDTTTVIYDLDQRRSAPFHSYVNDQYVFNSSGKNYITQNASALSVVDFSAIDFNKAYNLFYGNSSGDEVYESFGSLREKGFNTGQGPVLDIRFINTPNTIQITTYSSIKLDLANGQPSMVYPGTPWVSKYNTWPESEDITPFRNIDALDTMLIFDNNTKTIKSKVWLPQLKQIYTIGFFDHDKKCLLGGKGGTIACWNLDKNEPDYILSNIGGNGSTIFGVQQVPGTLTFVLLRENSRPFLFNALDGLILDSLPIGFARGIAFNHNRFWMTDSMGMLFTGTVNNLKSMDTLSFRSKTSFFDLIRLSQNGRFLLLLDEPFCHVMDTESGKIVLSFKPALSNLQCMAMGNDNKQLFIGSMNSEIGIYSLDSGKEISRIFLPTPSDPILTGPSGYYLATKQALQYVVFSKGYRTYNFEQFDLELNQPHKVLAAIGRTDEESLAAYQKAWEKRMKRNGIRLVNTNEAPAPSIIIHNRTSIKPTTSQDYYSIKTECFDIKNKLSELKVSVNDVPVRDTIFHLAKLDTSSIIINVAVPLTPGRNRIKIYCINNFGKPSYKEFIDIYNTSSPQKQKTWFIGLGVATYADTSQNLTYSVKDIRDLAKRFKAIYPNIIIDTLLDKQVTLQNLSGLKKRLEKISISDRIIMAVTGHGLLSKGLDFYYATYDVDFNNPEEKGLPYDQLEQILNQTLARQKLLLIDACHSGLVDKDNLLEPKSVVLTEDTANGEINIKESRGIKPRVTQKLDGANTFGLMQNMFADFSNDNGIVVISAAGGLEFALESARWNNGVFTYSVLKGLEGDADRNINSGNNDQKVSVQELMRYVGVMVPELTKGKQKPTSRRENLEFDWIIK